MPTHIIEGAAIMTVIKSKRFEYVEGGSSKFYLI